AVVKFITSRIPATAMLTMTIKMISSTNVKPDEVRRREKERLLMDIACFFLDRETLRCAAYRQIKLRCHELSRTCTKRLTQCVEVKGCNRSNTQTVMRQESSGWHQIRLPTRTIRSQRYAIRSRTNINPAITRHGKFLCITHH